MSLKPRKFSDIKRSQEEINTKMLKKRKETHDELPPYMYVISEGIKTEPYYIKGMADAINRKFFDFSSGPRIYVRGPEGIHGGCFLTPESRWKLISHRRKLSG